LHHEGGPTALGVATLPNRRSLPPLKFGFKGSGGESSELTSINREKIRWERLLWAFIAVAPWVRLLIPTSSSFRHLSASRTAASTAWSDPGLGLRVQDLGFCGYGRQRVSNRTLNSLAQDTSCRVEDLWGQRRGLSGTLPLFALSLANFQRVIFCKRTWSAYAPSPVGASRTERLLSSGDSKSTTVSLYISMSDTFTLTWLPAAWWRLTPSKM
jgi:hypothetical protein